MPTHILWMWSDWLSYWYVQPASYTVRPQLFITLCAFIVYQLSQFGSKEGIICSRWHMHRTSTMMTRSYTSFFEIFQDVCNWVVPTSRKRLFSILVPSTRCLILWFVFHYITASPSLDWCCWGLNCSLYISTTSCDACFHLLYRLLYKLSVYKLWKNTSIATLISNAYRGDRVQVLQSVIIIDIAWHTSNTADTIL